MISGFNNNEMQFLHSLFNYIFFDNNLQPLRVIVMPGFYEDDDDNWGIEAAFCPFPACNPWGAYMPGTIEFYIDVADGPREYIAAVLLHEMVHQYCFENNIADIDKETGKHAPAFVTEAEKHGLTLLGYRLTDEAKKTLIGLSILEPETIS